MDFPIPTLNLEWRMTYTNAAGISVSRWFSTLTECYVLAVILAESGIDDVRIAHRSEDLGDETGDSSPWNNDERNPLK